MVGTMAKIDDSIKKKVPELRFKGFTDDWEQRKLTEIVNRVNKSSNSDVLPKVEFEDIVSGEGRLNKDISSKFDSRKGTLFEPENILYGKLRPYLKNWLFSDFEGVALGDFWVFEATDVSVPSFDYYLIQSDNYQKVANDTSGTKMPRSDWKNVSSTDFAIPSKDEQKQIGAFFKQLDNTIVLHQRRLDLLKEQKKGYLQKMFPKNGAKVPELRFAGFTDDWEERKLRDLLNKNSEKNKNLSVINVESVSNKTGFTKQTDQFEDYSVASADLSNYYVIREKQFAYNPSRINVGSIAYKDLGDEISVVSPLYVSFSTKKVLNDGFFWNWFKTASFDAQRQRLSEGGVRDTLSFNQLSEMNTMFPTYPEQEKIASFFKQLDDTIVLHQRKLDLLKEQKKGFLQKMFV